MRFSLPPARCIASSRPLKRPTYVCAACCELIRQSPQSRGLPNQTLVSIRSKSSSSNGNSTPYVERLRRRIWGTDTPPGQVDPYSREAAGEAEQQGGEEQQSVEVEVTEDIAEEPDTSSLSRPPPISADTYVPADTWDGLERIGGDKGWWEADWDKAHKFEGFIASILVEHYEMRAVVRRALIELTALDAAGRPFSDASNLPVLSDFDFSTVDICCSGDGRVELKPTEGMSVSEILNILVGPADNVEAEVLATESQDSQAEIEGAENDRDMGVSQESTLQVGMQLETLGETSPPTTPRVVQDEGLEDIRIADLGFKFSLLKRILQISGHRIPDPKITQLQTIGGLLQEVMEKPRPKKLAEILLADPRLAALPNIEIKSKRYGPIDKEKDVGRWKLIEEELTRRKLPVTGHY